VFVGGYTKNVPDIPEGREGHMALNEYAAFDPIFWLQYKYPPAYSPLLPHH